MDIIIWWNSNLHLIFGMTSAIQVGAYMTTLAIHPLPLLQDNYAYLLIDEETGRSAVVDPSEAEPVAQTFYGKGLKPDYILSTHHHWDHTNGNLGLKQLFRDCQVVGPSYDMERIPGLDLAVDEASGFLLGSQQAEVIFVPGHTRGHIAYFFPEAKALFCGDTLFSLGCGRLFEGSAGQMFQSLQKLKALPDDTQIYCGHEYTLNNARFALTVEPQNAQLRERLSEVERLRAKGHPTVPALLADERVTNPFLTTQSVAEFAERRRLKDAYQG